jgi:hypothetical protein
LGQQKADVCEEATMTGQANEIQWYIARDGKQHGPLTDVEMRTFVAHNYLRQSDLIWRPGMSEWQAAPAVFPAAFHGAVQQQVQTQRADHSTPAQSYSAHYAKPMTAARDAHSSDFDAPAEPQAERSIVKRLAAASVAITLVGGAALSLAVYRQPLMEIVSGSSGAATGDQPPVISAPADTKSADATPQPPSAPQPDSPPAATAPAEAASGTGMGNASLRTIQADSADAPTPTSPASPNQPTTTSSVSAPDAPKETQVAAVAPEPPAPPPPPAVDGSPLDMRLQKVPVWALIKRDYPDWYVSQISAANKLTAENKSNNDVAMLLAQGLVSLRRQNSEKALAASSDKLQAVAAAFLDHLKSLRAQSVSACFGFISKGETSPAVVQMMENPETATALNAQADAIFEAISEGGRNPVKHDAAVKSDYDILIKELGKLGWKEEDLQVFSNPKLLAKREPEQVCKMVQEWFVAHLAVQDKAVRDRLLFETLKPVVSG